MTKEERQAINFRFAADRVVYRDGVQGYIVKVWRRDGKGGEYFAPCKTKGGAIAQVIGAMLEGGNQ